jgi:uncharacterized protein YraI
MQSQSISRLLAITMLAVAFLVIGLSTAFAATARASGAPDVRSGPGNGYAIIGRLSNNERVSLDQCTRNSRWCLVYNGDMGGAQGWVLGSYLIGAPAKVDATPPTFLVPFGHHRQ